MSHTINYQHIVFHTLYNQCVIPEATKRVMFVYILKMCQTRHVNLMRINAYLNHIHMLVNLPSSISVADFVKMIKQNTSVAFKCSKNFPRFMGWSEGYGAFSVSVHDSDAVANYIKNQEQHHHGQVSFRDEYISLLRENGIAFDENTLKDM